MSNNSSYNFSVTRMLHHRVMAAIMGTILKLPPLKQTLAMKQVKSRYLERLIQKKN